MAVAAERARFSAPRVVEVVGPAGAGKTTLLEELCRRSDRIHPILGFSRPAYAPWFAVTALGVLPFAMLWWQRDKALSWLETTRLLRLRTSQLIVRWEASRRPIVGLDQGPIYTLATLPDYGARSIRGRSFDKWWDRILRDWADTLDLVVCLDAPDELLIERIRGREKWHAVKAREDTQAKDLLEKNRAACRRALGIIGLYRSPTLLRYQTGESGVAEIVGEVLAALEPGSLSAGLTNGEIQCP